MDAPDLGQRSGGRPARSVGLTVSALQRPASRKANPVDSTLVVVCANNEAQNLRILLGALSGLNVLVVDDGSTDGTRQVAISRGAALLNHPRRMGKPFSLQDGIRYAVDHGFESVVVCDADTIPTAASIESLVERIQEDGVGAAVARQIPIGEESVALFLDELFWAILDEGKRVQSVLQGSCHLGGVLYAAKAGRLPRSGPCINDDENLGLLIKESGLRTVFDEDSIAYFDASSCLGHIFERRKRMNMGHLLYDSSTAPSMNVRIAAVALLRALIGKPRRLVWALPTVAIEILAKLAAWREIRMPGRASAQVKWVTSYRKRAFAPRPRPSGVSGLSESLR
jgi:cellulose synthase/poly-beta-1,6-N-acetylglucosamine synthase-like glycosyltransferase